MRLEEINWPVFVLKREKPITKDGVTAYIDLKLVLNTNELVQKILVIDDKNLPGDTLGRRRLELAATGVTMYKLRRALYMICDLIRVANRATWLIDSSGRVFNYEKNSTAPLTCHRISKVLRAGSAGFIIEVEGVAERFKLLNGIHNCKYAGILHYNRKKLFYGLYEEPFNTTYRQI